MGVPVLRIRGEDGAMHPVLAIRGQKGEPGPQGPAGPAYTLTTEDKAAITQAVLTQLPIWTGGSY